MVRTHPGPPAFMAHERSEIFEHKLQQLRDAVEGQIPVMEAALNTHRGESNDPSGDLYSLNLCNNAWEVFSPEVLEKTGLEPRLFSVEAGGRFAVHCAYYQPEIYIVVDATCGQWLDSKGIGLTALIRDNPRMFVGRVLAASPYEISSNIGWDYKITKT